MAALIVGLGIFVAQIPWLWVGYIWAYCFVWIFVEDAAKLLVCRHLDMTSRPHRRFLARARFGLFAHGMTPTESKGTAPETPHSEAGGTAATT
jgi:H+-transporting ATPase